MLNYLLYTLTCASLLLVAYFVLVPYKPKFKGQSSEGSDDDGGEPVGYDLPDLDLPPGISLPINDFEPDYNKKGSRIFVDADGLLVISK